MPRLLVPQHLNLEGSLSLEEDMSLDEKSQGNHSSPHVSSEHTDASHKSGSNAGAGMLDPNDAEKTTENHNGDALAESGSQVSLNSAFVSADELKNAREASASTEAPVTNGGSKVESLEQVPRLNGHSDHKDSELLQVRDRKVNRHSNGGIATLVPALSNRLNSKKKTALSPRLQAMSKELGKDQLPSPKLHGSRTKDSSKERAASPRVSSPTANAVRAKDGDKGKVEPLSLPSLAAPEESENGVLLTTDVDKTRSSAKDLIKVKERIKPLSLTASGKRPAPLKVKASENILPAENTKDEATMSNENNKSSPKSLTSPTKSNAKSGVSSPHKSHRMTPPSSSEKSAALVDKVSPEKTAAHPFNPESPVSSTKATDKKSIPDKGLSERESTSSLTEKTIQKPFLKRKVSVGSKKFGDTESIASSECTNLLTRDNPNLGPYLLKLAKQSIIAGDNPQKALDYATRAAKSYEIAADGRPSLEFVMSLHILAATHCTLGQFEEAIPVLQHSIAVTDIEAGGHDHALAAFAGNMQLGDTYALLGKGEDALGAYRVGLEIQKTVLGEMDPHVGETCRYLAEAHTQAMQFDEAGALCQHALNIHKEHSAPASIEEATDRRLMGLICNGKGEHEAALEHLVLASMALIANGKDADVAAVDASIGDTYVCLGRFDEAVFSYQKALTVFKSSKGENHVAVASIYVSLAELYLKTGKFRECKTYCDCALKIFNKQGIGTMDEVASGLTELAVVFEALNDQEQALLLLKKALRVLDSAPGQQSSIAGIEAQIGVLSYMCGNYVDARSSLGNAVSKLRGSAERTSPLFGIVLNQMGLCCLHLSEIRMAAQLFEEARSVMETACGPHHPDTISVYSNLAGAYDALGRLDDAIGVLQHVVEVREEELGTANLEVEDERSRLAELLKEAGRFRARRLNNTLGLLMHPKPKPSTLAMPGQNMSSVSVKG